MQLSASMLYFRVVKHMARRPKLVCQTVHTDPQDEFTV